MALFADVQVVGFDKDSAPIGRLKRAMLGVVVDSSFRILADAQANCPVGKTGRLKSSLRTTFRTTDTIYSAKTGTDLFYGPFVEFGTGQAGAATGAIPPGSDYSHGPKPGMPAQPFLFPASERERLVFLANLEKVLG